MEVIMQIKPRPNPLVEVLNFFADAAKAFWQRTAAVNELTTCDAVELGRVAQDLGISPADLRSLASRDKTAADLLNRRFRDASA